MVTNIEVPSPLRESPALDDSFEHGLTSTTHRSARPPSPRCGRGISHRYNAAKSA